MFVRLSAVILASAAYAAGACEDLSSLKLDNAAITSAQVVAAGAFRLPGGRGGRGGNPYQALPAFCRVQATLTPTSDSDIKVEVWLPVSGWNNKYLAVGNGGWAGTISYTDLADGVSRGYATSSTDTGHTGGSGSFVLGHPEKFIDFAWRSEHEMTVKSKLIVVAMYGGPAKYSFWKGCSTGGRQAMKEVQMFPDDFDGVIAGSQANPRTGMALLQAWVAFAALKDPESRIPVSKFPMIHAAVIQTCDALDGLKDGLIQDPRKCHFDPKALQCKGADAADCLTAGQVIAARKMYEPARNVRTGKAVSPAFTPGNELGWAALLRGPEPSSLGMDQFRYVVFKDPNWDWRTFDFDKDIDRTIQADNGRTDARNPDIKPFLAHNGKLLLYHGWSDQLVPTETTISYYEEVAKKMGGVSKIDQQVRMFLAPGMGHCGGGDGPNSFDSLAALEQWVESGKAPEKMIASHSTAGKTDRTRPLCAYPKAAKYAGSGSIDDATNFVCK
jgi:Tannase and feruloyl esterase